MTTLDECEIRSLLIAERQARDLGEFKRMRDCYHPDSDKTRVHIMWYDGAIDGFVAASERLHSDKVAILHQLIPARIQVKGSKALADSWCIIQTRNTSDGPEFDMTMWLRMFSQCQKVDGRWKMLTLEPIYLRDLVTAVPPSPLPDFGDLSRHRPSYRFSAWSVGQRGLTIRDDLPGADRPDTVAEVVNRNQAWLDTD